MAFVAITQDCGLGAKVARDSTVCNGRGCVPVKLYLQSQPWSSGLILLVMKTGLLDPVIPWAGVREHLGHSRGYSAGVDSGRVPPQTGSTWTVIFSVFFVLGLLEQEKHVLTSLFFLSYVFNTNLPFLPKQTDVGP